MAEAPNMMGTMLMYVNHSVQWIATTRAGMDASVTRNADTGPLRFHLATSWLGTRTCRLAASVMS